MTRCNGSIIGPANEPTNTVAGGVWRLREAATYLQADEWPSQPAVPPAPTAVAGNARVSLSWTAPSGGSPITDYGIEYSSNSGSTWTTFADGVSTSTSAVVTGLTNGTAYIFRLVTINPLGEVYGSASASVTPEPAVIALLLHFDGTNGGTTFTDSSPAALTVTRNGDAVISTAQSKFGGASGYFDGAGDYLTAPSSALSGLGDGDFTIEAFIRADADNLNAICTVDYDATGSFWLGLYQGQVACFGNGSQVAAGGDVQTGQWHHVAVTRLGGAVTLWLDGASVGTGSFGGGITLENAIGIGGGYSGTYPFSGYIDELRIVKGNAVYTGNFTPPTAPF
jgi:hypothetical protein